MPHSTLGLARAERGVRVVGVVLGQMASLRRFFVHNDEYCISIAIDEISPMVLPSTYVPYLQLHYSKRWIYRNRLPQGGRSDF